MSAPAAWLADPTGRHQLRYWDGVKWTDYVSDAGAQSMDPVGSPPASMQQQARVAPQSQPVGVAAQPVGTVAQPAAQAAATEAAAPAETNNALIADELAKLAGLRDRGILTDEEFTAQKAKLLGT